MRARGCVDVGGRNMRFPSNSSQSPTIPKSDVSVSENEEDSGVAEAEKVIVVLVLDLATKCSLLLEVVSLLDKRVIFRWFCIVFWKERAVQSIKLSLVQNADPSSSAGISTTSSQLVHDQRKNRCCGGARFILLKLMNDT